jgi:hypothetical protein
MKKWYLVLFFPTFLVILYFIYRPKRYIINKDANMYQLELNIPFSSNNEGYCMFLSEIKNDTLQPFMYTLYIDGKVKFSKKVEKYYPYRSTYKKYLFPRLVHTFEPKTVGKKLKVVLKPLNGDKFMENVVFTVRFLSDCSYFN